MSVKFEYELKDGRAFGVLRLDTPDGKLELSLSDGVAGESSELAHAWVMVTMACDELALRIKERDGG